VQNFSINLGAITEFKPLEERHEASSIKRAHKMFGATPPLIVKAFKNKDVTKILGNLRQAVT
jgi:hypothetical protein